MSASSGGTYKAAAASYTESSTAADAISGFRGKILTKDRSEAHVYSDIENAVAKGVSGIYRSSSAAGEPKSYSVVVTPTEDDQQIPWSEVKRADSKEDVDRSGAASIMTFAGSVTGLAGTFSCTGTCVAPVRETDGSVTADNAEGGWTFAPTDPNGTIDVADSGYVQFGWWLNMKGKKVEDGFDVDTFASAPGMTAIAAPLQGSAVTGSATYTGGAAGKWAIASTTEDTTEGGHFTATATFGVDFDAALPSGEDGNKDGVSFSGEITDFMTGATSRPNWNVTLTLVIIPLTQDTPRIQWEDVQEIHKASRRMDCRRSPADPRSALAGAHRSRRDGLVGRRGIALLSERGRSLGRRCCHYMAC